MFIYLDTLKSILNHASLFQIWVLFNSWYFAVFYWYIKKCPTAYVLWFRAFNFLLGMHFCRISKVWWIAFRKKQRRPPLLLSADLCNKSLWFNQLSCRDGQIGANHSTALNIVWLPRIGPSRTLIQLLHTSCQLDTYIQKVSNYPFWQNLKNFTLFKSNMNKTWWYMLIMELRYYHFGYEPFYFYILIPLCINLCLYLTSKSFDICTQQFSVSPEILFSENRNHLT